MEHCKGQTNIEEARDAAVKERTSTPSPEAKQAAESEFEEEHLRTTFPFGGPACKRIGYYVQQAIDIATAKLREECAQWRQHYYDERDRRFAHQEPGAADEIAGITTGAIQRTLDQTFSASARESVKTIIHEALANISQTKTKGTNEK